LVVLSPVGLAVVVVGRDPSVPFPDGCALLDDDNDDGSDGDPDSSPNGDINGDGDGQRNGDAPQQKTKRRKHADPFTHRPLFAALGPGTTCARFVATPPGSSSRPPCDTATAIATVEDASSAPGVASGALPGQGVVSGGSVLRVDVTAVASALVAALRDDACALAAAPV